MVDEELGKALSQISPEVLALEGKMGPFLDIVKAYLDVKSANYIMLNTKTSDGEDNRTILIGDDRNSIQISEPIPAWECGTEFLVKTQDNITVSSMIYDPTLIFKTKRDSTDLEINAIKSAPVPVIDDFLRDSHIGIGLTMSVIIVEIKNILQTPSKFPGTKPEEMYYVLCECKNEMISCKGSAVYNLF